MPKYTTGETPGPFRNDTVFPVAPGLPRQPPPLTFGASPSMRHIKHRHPAEGRQGLPEFHYSSQRVLMSLFKLQVKIKQVLILLASAHLTLGKTTHIPWRAVISTKLNHSWCQLLNQQPPRLPSQLHFKNISSCVSLHQQSQTIHMYNVIK